LSDYKIITINEFWTDKYIVEVKDFNDGGKPPICQVSWDYVKLVAHAKQKWHGSHDVTSEIMDITNGSANPNEIMKEYWIYTRLNAIANQHETRA